MEKNVEQIPASAVRKPGQKPEMLAQLPRYVAIYAPDKERPKWQDVSLS